jgi:hypothetical protein
MRPKRDPTEAADMKHLVFGSILALSVAVVTPACADFTLIRFADGRCEIWLRSRAVPWGAGWTKIAITADWWTAQVARDWAIMNGACIL